jgi:hypothetical protein
MSSTRRSHSPEALRARRARRRPRTGLVHGHCHRVVALFRLGDLAGVDLTTRISSQVAERLKQPAERWLVMMTESLLSLSRGRLEKAERLIEEVRAVG